MERTPKAGRETTQGLNLPFPVAKQVWAGFHPRYIYTTQTQPRGWLLLIKRSALEKHLRLPALPVCGVGGVWNSQFNTQTRKVCSSEREKKSSQIPILIAGKLQSEIPEEVGEYTRGGGGCEK